MEGSSPPKKIDDDVTSNASFYKKKSVCLHVELSFV